MPCNVTEVCEDIEATLDTKYTASQANLYPRPDYSQKFRCLAEACDENCCSGWSIPIDADTLESYRNHPTLKPFTEALIVLNQHSHSSGDAAHMPLTHQGTCAFLNEEKLCGIHAHFGPSLLSNACATYPREIYVQSGHREAALNLSCPEAVRLTLLDPNLLGSGPWQTFGPGRYTHIAHRSRLPASFDPILALRELTLLIISDPTYLLWERLYILGDLTQRLQILAAGVNPRHWARENRTAIAALIDETTDTVAFHTLHLPDIQADPSLQLRFANRILQTRLSEPPVPERFVANVQAFNAGLGCDVGRTAPLTDAQITHTFQSAYRYHARPLLDRHPQLIENFLANHIFKHSYPFGRADGGKIPAPPTGQHLALVAYLSLTQTLLVGLAAHHREQLTTDHVVRLIQSLSKAIEHRPASVAHLTQVLSDQQLTTPKAQAQLLKLSE